MKLNPSQNEAKLATREGAVDRLEGVDPDLGVPSLDRRARTVA